MMKSKIRNSLGLLNSVARNIMFEEFTDLSKKLAEQLCKLVDENLDFLFENSFIVSPVFFKLCKLLALWQAYDADALVRGKLSKLLTQIWERHSRSCLRIGRDLVRVTQTVLKSPDFDYFIQQFTAKSSISEYTAFLQSR